MAQWSAFYFPIELRVKILETVEKTLIVVCLVSGEGDQFGDRATVRREARLMPIAFDGSK